IPCIPKSKQNRTIVARLISSAGTGFFYTTTRRRAVPKLTLRKYDPIGIFIYPYYHTTKLNYIFNANHLFFCT
ncbi:hypothetical protein BC829DRAFT_362074, partial [Chytridium lagenaria]